MGQALGGNALAIVTVLFFVFFGASSQRITGMGFALVAAPFLVLALGPISGVLIVNLGGAISSSLILTRVWRYTEWAKVGYLIPTALIGIATGLMISRITPSAWLEIGIGAIVLLSLSTSLLVRSRRRIAGPVPLALAGFSSGFMSYTAGVGGPAMSVYAVLSRWPQTQFAATMQPYFLVAGLCSFLGKVLFVSGAVPALPWWLWLGIAVALLAGVGVGDLTANRIQPSHARTALIAVAYLGSVLTIAKGTWTLTTGA